MTVFTLRQTQALVWIARRQPVTPSAYGRSAGEPTHAMWQRLEQKKMIERDGDAFNLTAEATEFLREGGWIT